MQQAPDQHPEVTLLHHIRVETNFEDQSLLFDATLSGPLSTLSMTREKACQ